MRLIIISGLSGSGKTTAIKAVEDLDFFCIDNLPPMFLEKFVTVAGENPETTKVAVVMDVRSKAFREAFQETIDAIGRLNIRPEIIYLTADTATLIKRYSETRRKHPLQGDDSVAHGVEKEELLLSPIKAMADTIIDTTDRTVHQIRKAVHDFIDKEGEQRFKVVVQSFGFKHGVPIDVDYIFDVRCLPNPYFVDNLRAQTGLDLEVEEYLNEQAEVGEYYRSLRSFLKMAVPHHYKEGKLRLNIGVGCTGGRHRSVFMARRVCRYLRRKGFKCSLRHRDVKK